MPRPVRSGNITPAYLFRKVADPAGLPTLHYDEVDTVFSTSSPAAEEIRGLLNAGHRRGAKVGRCVVSQTHKMLQGYRADDLQDAWHRYVPDLPDLE